MSRVPEFLTPEQARFLDDAHLQRIFDRIEAAGGEIRVNGGAVRNALLGEPVHEVDLSTTLVPDRVTAVLEAGGCKVVATGIDHGTVTAVTGGRGYEITTLREDIETTGRHAVVLFGTDWHADAMRRDFTINALYCDRNGRLFDPLDGYGDIAERQVRFIGDPEERIREDYLRILRFFRFFAWYGHGRPDGDGLKACARLKQQIARLSVERVWQELKRLLAAPDPTRAVLWSRTTGVLAVALPESGEWGTDMLAQMVAIEKEAGRGADPLLRLMCLLPPRAERARALGERLKLSRQERKRLDEWAGQQVPDPVQPSADFEQLLYRGQPQAIADALGVELARERTYQGMTARAGALAKKRELAIRWKRPAFPIAGRDLVPMGLKAGPALGEMLKRLEIWWIDHDFRPGKPELLAEAKRRMSEGSV